MASEPTATRDVRPVVAAGLCLIAVILAWPLLYGRGGDVAVPARQPDDAPQPAPSAAPAPTPAPAPAARIATHDVPAPTLVNRPVASPPSARPPAPARRGADNAPAGAPEQEQKTGINLFPPPGTDPPKAGIIVPDGYELPPGYVRHYQTTDDGTQLPPILMFHPDFQPVDERGQPIPLPADRVVPPDMAPTGIPHDVLQVPPTHVPFVEDPSR